jgi:hypothetical protein
VVDRLPIPVLKFPIHGKDEDPFSELHIDIGEEAQNFGSGDLADLLAELVTTLCDQILPEPLDHFHTFGSFGQLPLSRRENTFQPDDNQVSCDKRANLIRTSSKELLLELDDRVAYRVFHTFFPVDCRL